MPVQEEPLRVQPCRVVHSADERALQSSTVLVHMGPEPPELSLLLPHPYIVCPFDPKHMSSPVQPSLTPSGPSIVTP